MRKWSVCKLNGRSGEQLRDLKRALSGEIESNK